MKKIFTTTLFAFSVIFTFSQGVNFQGVARSANGTILASANISLRLSIISKNVDATPEYVEIKTVATNAQGIFSVVVGDASSTAVIGNFKNIAWSDGIKFLKVEMDPAAGTNFINMGTTQLQYVPYAFYSLGVDATGVKGVLSVKAGGTGVSNLDSLKAALKITNIDTISLSNRIDTKASLINPVFSGVVTASSYKIPNGTSTQYLKADGTVSTSVTAGVPYTGASQAVDLGAYDLKVNGLTVGVGGGQIATNTAFGIGVLNSNTTGSLNSAFGSGALNLNTTGSLNSSFGSNALFFNTTGSSNSAFGNEALGSNRTGQNNTSIGDNSLRTNVGNSNSVAIGYKAMYYADNRATGRSTGNTAVGFEALRGSIIASNNTGINNTAIGTSTLFNNTTGSQNNAFGTNALNRNTTGSNNTALGRNTMYSNLTGSNNIAIGDEAMIASTTGVYNIAIGNQTLYNSTTSSYNTVIGYHSLYSNTGDFNTVMGYGSMAFNTTGENNLSLGAGSLNINTTGSNNTAVGSGALMSNTSANNNVAIGLSSLGVNSNGYSNTAIGVKSLNANINGNRNTAIGDSAFLNGADYINSTAIGYNAQVTASNQIQLGNSSITDVKTSGSITVKRYVTNTPVDLSFSTASNQIDLSLGNIISINLSGNVSLTFSNALPGTYILKFIQDATGSRIATFPVTNWRWAGGSAPTLSTSANTIDIVSLIFDGTTYFATIVKGF